METIGIHEFRAMQQAQPKRKYGNTKVNTPDGEFDSKIEYKRWIDLNILLKAGKISDLRRQQTYELQEKFRANNGKAQRAITYTPDFEYIENGKQVVEDVKGFADQKFSIKERLFRYRFPNIDFRVLKK